MAVVGCSQTTQHSARRAAPVTTSDAVPPRPTLRLARDGVRLTSGHLTNPFGFGVATFSEAGSIESGLGSPTEVLGPAPCPDGSNDTTQLLRWTTPQQSLQVVFVDGKLASWLLVVLTEGEPVPAHQSAITVEGIGLGSTLSDLRRAYGSVEPFTSPASGGYFWTAGGYHGSITSAAPEGVVTGIQAGRDCIGQTLGE